MAAATEEVSGTKMSAAEKLILERSIGGAEKVGEEIGEDSLLAGLTCVFACVNYPRARDAFQDFLSHRIHTVLDVSDHGIVTLPPAFFASEEVNRRLVEFDCSRNYLTELPAALGTCVALQTLDCDNNELRTLPAELFACADLNVLLAANNPFTDLPAKSRELFDIDGNSSDQEDSDQRFDRRTWIVGRLRKWWAAQLAARRVKAARAT